MPLRERSSSDRRESLRSCLSGMPLKFSRLRLFRTAFASCCAASPALMLLLPAGFAQAHPAAHAALVRNQHRRVTAFDLHATLSHLADWPTMPQPSLEATSLFVDLSPNRTCEQARVPAKFCIEV